MLTGTGLALLASFQRTLRQTTQQHALCSLLINDVAEIEHRSLGRGFTPTSDRRSIFQSVNVVPGLGYTYAQILDLSILLSRLPRMHYDAEALCAHNSELSFPWESTVVFEILFDRWGSRDGQWAAFATQNTKLRSLQGSTSAR
jgi:hypothetical protein